jgi:hypothetical protein
MITHHRRRDGLLSIVDADEADGLPPMHLLEGGAWVRVTYRTCQRCGSSTSASTPRHGALSVNGSGRQNSR